MEVVSVGEAKTAAMVEHRAGAESTIVDGAMKSPSMESATMKSTPMESAAVETAAVETSPVEATTAMTSTSAMANLRDHPI